MKVCLGVAK